MSAKTKQEGDTERVHCNGCTGMTLHRLVKRVVDSGTEEIDRVGEVWWKTTFDVLQCCGCSEVVLRRTSLFSETMPDEDVRYFPPKVSRRPPQWRYRLPHALRTIVEEVYAALDAGSRALPLMGARTLIDLLMEEKIGDIGGFQQKLKELERQGFISSKNREVLAAALDMGSAAAHRGFAPTVEDVHAVMDIVENLLQAVYILNAVAKRLRTATPRRAKKKSGAPSGTP